MGHIMRIIIIMLLCFSFSYLLEPVEAEETEGGTFPYFARYFITDSFTGENLFLIEMGIHGDGWPRELREDDKLNTVFLVKNLQNKTFTGLEFKIAFVDEDGRTRVMKSYRLDKFSLDDVYENLNNWVGPLSAGSYTIAFSMTGYYSEEFSEKLIIEDPLPYVKQWYREVQLGYNDVEFLESLLIKNFGKEPITRLKFVYTGDLGTSAHAWMYPNELCTPQISIKNENVIFNIVLREPINVGEIKQVSFKVRIANCFVYPHGDYPFDSKAIFSILPYPRGFILSDNAEIEISRIDWLSQKVILARGLKFNEEALPPIEAKETFAFGSLVKEHVIIQFAMFRIPGADLWESEIVSFSSPFHVAKNLSIAVERTLLHKIIFYGILFYSLSIIFISLYHVAVQKRRREGYYKFYLQHIGMIFIFYMASMLVLPRPYGWTRFESLLTWVSISLFILAVCEGVRIKERIAFIWVEVKKKFRLLKT